ncbi:MAG: hypothetical protein H6647_19690 [Anaerolineales bacterium]|nr:hypothetical protein [Anaerolineales bacterium]
MLPAHRPRNSSNDRDSTRRTTERCVARGKPVDANPYIALLRAGLADAGVAATIVDDPGPDGLPEPARRADIVHLHWLELWGRPPYRSLQHLARWGVAGRAARDAGWSRPSTARPFRCPPRTVS